MDGELLKKLSTLVVNDGCRILFCLPVDGRWVDWGISSFVHPHSQFGYFNIVGWWGRCDEWNPFLDCTYAHTRSLWTNLIYLWNWTNCAPEFDCDKDRRKRERGRKIIIIQKMKVSGTCKLPPTRQHECGNTHIHSLLILVSVNSGCGATEETSEYGRVISVFIFSCILPYLPERAVGVQVREGGAFICLGTFIWDDRPRHTNYQVQVHEGSASDWPHRKQEAPSQR